MRVVPLAQVACNRSDDPFDCWGSSPLDGLEPRSQKADCAGLSSSLIAPHAHSSSASAPRPLTAHRLPPNEGCLSLPNCQYWQFVEQRASSPDDRQHTLAQAAEDTIYISMCSGGAMVKVSVAERPQFI